jgi:hypothetical protein
MDGAREVATKGLNLSLAAIRHTGWWLRWHTARQGTREVTELGLLAAKPAGAQRPAA